MSEELIPEPLQLEEQVSLELVKHNYTEAKLQEFEEYLKLEIIDGDKESYLLVKEKRKEVKSYRVAAEKFCKFKREPAVLIQKAWVKKEDLISGRLSAVEDHLEAKEKAYEKKVSEEKEARKRKQEEQLIVRQQTLTNMGALYSDGNFTLGDVSYEYSLIKESEEDIWTEAILPKFKEEYEKLEQAAINAAEAKRLQDLEFKRQQEELEQKQKELAEKEAKLKEEEVRQAIEADKRRAIMIETRTNQITAIGFDVYNSNEYYKFREYTILLCDIHDHCDADWNGLVADATKYVEITKAEEAEEKRKEQERKDLQQKRLEELMPYSVKGAPFTDLDLGNCSEEEYQFLFNNVKSLYEKAEEEKKKQIEEAAAKKERERIEEEQRQEEIKTKQDIRNRRRDALLQYNYVLDSLHGDLAHFTDEQWVELVTKAKASYDENIRKQEEERKAEELAKASDKEKWDEIVKDIDALRVLVGSLVMRSGQYRKKRQMLIEKLEEIKAL